MLEVDGVSVHFGGVVAVEGAALALDGGDGLAVVGPNGSGKTTLLNAVTGLVDRTGRVAVDGVELPRRRPGPVRRAGILRTFQTPQVLGDLTCLENALLATGDRHLTGVGAAWLARRRMVGRERERSARARECLERFGLGPVASLPASRLTYGQRRWLELARVAVAEPRYLLADEPSAGLNDVETARLADHLLTFRAAGVGLVLVDHKVDFLRRVADRALVLALGAEVAQGPIDEVWDLPAVQDAYLGTRRVGR